MVIDAGRVLGAHQAFGGGLDLRFETLEAHVEKAAPALLHRHARAVGGPSLVHHLDLALTHRNPFDHGRREAHLPAVDAHQRAFDVGAYHHRPGRRRRDRQRNVDGRDRVADDVYLEPRLLEAGRGDEQHVAPGHEPRRPQANRNHPTVGRPFPDRRARREAAEHDGPEIRSRTEAALCSFPFTSSTATSAER